MSFQHPSNKLRTLIKKVRAEETEERAIAFNPIIDEIEDSAQSIACIRCQNAEWGFFLNEELGQWLSPILLACKAGMSLPARHDDFGLHIPMHFFCTSENNLSYNPNQSADSSAGALPKSNVGRGLSATEVMAEAIKLRRQGQRP